MEIIFNIQRDFIWLLHHTSDDMEDIRPRTWFRQREQLHGHGSLFHCQVPNSKIVHDFNSTWLPLNYSFKENLRKLWRIESWASPGWPRRRRSFHTHKFCTNVHTRKPIWLHFRGIWHWLSQEENCGVN